MKNELIITFIVLLLVLPGVLAQVKIQLGEPYVNIEDFSQIKFTAHPNYYEICSLDKTVIPVLIKNGNNFSDTFTFVVDKEYVSLPVKSTVLKSGKSAILPLTISPSIDLEENTTSILDITTKKEGLKRRVIIKTNVKKCYLSNLKIDKDKDDICGCDKGVYSLILTNEGRYTDTFTLTLDIPQWVNSTLTNNTITLYDGQKREIKLEANPPCEEKGVFTVSAEAISEKTKATLKDKLELTILPMKECYNTVISADNVEIDYFGKNIPIILENKGVKDATYSLTVEGVDWYKLSQTDFSLKRNKVKTINLVIYPDENVVEGNYNIDIIAKTDSQEFTKSITVKLKKTGTSFGKIKFYLNYFRYYIGLGIVLLIIILFLIIIIKKREKKEVKEKPKEKFGKEVKKEEKKKVVKKIEEQKKKIKWSFILYLIFLALLILFIYSTFRYWPYNEKASGFISKLFTNYVVPYMSYLKYVVAGVGALIILLLTIDFFKKKAEKEEIIEEERKEVVEEKQKEKKARIGKVSRKTIKRRKFNFKYIYAVLAILLLLAIAVYGAYKSSGKLISIGSKTWGRTQSLGKLMVTFIQSYYFYFIMGIIFLVLFVVIIKFIKKTKKIKKRFKKFFKILISIIIGLIVLGGIVYSFVYYNLLAYIKGFFIVYYPYILMGAGILIILILILHFHSKNIS